MLMRHKIGNTNFMLAILIKFYPRHQHWAIRNISIIFLPLDYFVRSGFSGNADGPGR